jgi:hypothetical protein
VSKRCSMVRSPDGSWDASSSPPIGPLLRLMMFILMTCRTGGCAGTRSKIADACSAPGGKVPSRISVPPSNSPPRPPGASRVSLVMLAAGIVAGVPNFIKSSKAARASRWTGESSNCKVVVIVMGRSL